MICLGSLPLTRTSAKYVLPQTPPPGYVTLLVYTKLCRIIINNVNKQAIPKSFLFFRENFLLLVCEVFRAHEMRSQLEVTEMLEYKVN